MSTRKGTMQAPQRPNSLRLPGFNYSSETTYFLTVCTKNKKPIFTSNEQRQLTREIFRHYSDKLGLTLIASVIMPDHLHLIVYNPGAKKVSIGELMRRSKSRLYQEFRKRFGLVESFWQRFYYDHIIRNDRDFEEKLNYILDNPGKKGLTTREADLDFIYLNLGGFGST